MDEDVARKILGGSIRPSNDLRDLDGEYLSWHADNKFSNKATLDGEFSADDLEAIAWWMRNKHAKS